MEPACKLLTATGRPMITLPLVIGDGAADDALMIIRALERRPVLEEGPGGA